MGLDHLVQMRPPKPVPPPCGRHKWMAPNFCKCGPFLSKICTRNYTVSVVPVLSRIVERELVHQYLYPSFLIPPMSDLLADQFAFRPTGSTTAAVIGISHQRNTCC